MAKDASGSVHKHHMHTEHPQDALGGKPLPIHTPGAAHNMMAMYGCLSILLCCQNGTFSASDSLRLHARPLVCSLALPEEPTQRLGGVHIGRCLETLSATSLACNSSLVDCFASVWLPQFGLLQGQPQTHSRGWAPAGRLGAGSPIGLRDPHLRATQSSCDIDCGASGGHASVKNLMR